jgi:LVIVD repeat-containing protein
MRRRFSVLTAACAVSLALAADSAMAHHPPEEFGTPLESPFGLNTWFSANFQTAQNPFNAANTHVTSSDIAFWDNLAYVGDYGGFRIFDISKPTPKLVSDVRCYGPQGDPSVFDRDRDGDADTLVLSVDSVLAGPQCGAAPVSKSAATGRYPEGAWEGIRVFDVSNPRAPTQVATVYQDCGSHTNTLLPAPRGKKSMYVLNSSYPLGEGPTCGPLGEAAGRKVNHGVVQVVEVPFRDPADARELTELPIVYPGDADGVYKPVSDHGIVAPLDNFLGCHDISTFPAKGIVGAACGEQAQVWDIDRRTGLPDTADPKWAYDQPNVDFWHSATFSWDGKIANFIDESFGDGCPTVTTKTGGLAGGPRQFETGNMFFFTAKRGRLLSEYRVSRPTNDNTSPTTGKYCSSHLGIPVPAKDRYLLVNAFYRGGSSVIDFSDPTAPKEIAFADMDGTNTWSAYTYPRRSGSRKTIPVYSNDGLSRNYGTAAEPRYPEAAYGFQRFEAKIGRANLVGFNHLNPQLQEKVVPVRLRGGHKRRFATPRTYAYGKPAPQGARNRSARPYTK